MMLNVAVLAYVILLAYWLGTEGFFSSMMHLGMVIISGALAFALWEPITYGFLAGMMPRFASAIGLIMPFVVFLLIFRFALDKLVKTNLDFSSLTNLIGGGALGVIAASLSAGIFMIGISRLPAPDELFGVKPYIVKDNGKVAPDPAGGSLWLPVDEWAAGFFSTLSGGSFYPANDMPMAKVRPDIVRVGHLNRLRTDRNSSIVAHPGAVEIKAHEVHNTPVEGLPQVFIDNLPKHGSPPLAEQLKGDGHKLVILDTEWNNAPDTMVYDGGVAVRVYPTQVRLLTYTAAGEPKLHAPIAITRIGNLSTREREFTPISDYKVVAKELSSSNVSFAWVFIVPKTEMEEYLYIRDRRFDLPNAEIKNKPEAQSVEKVAALIGPRLYVSPDAVAANTNGGTDTPKDDGKTPSVGEKQGGRSNIKAEDIQITGALPAHTSRNLAPSLVVNEKNQVRSGEASVGPPGGPISRALIIKEFELPAGNGIVRVKLTPDMAQSLLGHSVASAGALNALFLRDDLGSEIYPFSYVWTQASGTMHVHVDANKQIRAVTTLPYRKMGPGDELYVYFYVRQGAKVLSINVGNLHKQDVENVEIPKE